LRDNRNYILLSITFVFAVLGAVLLIAWTTGPFYYHFADTRLVDLYAFFQLFATACVAFFACKKLEQKHSLKWRNNPSARPFFISAAGFLFLLCDDLFSIHENIDKLIHFAFYIKETPWTDHIDDFILLAYGIIALFFIKDFIREFKKHPYMVGLIICGFCAFFMVFYLDFVTNNVETFIYFFDGLFSGDMTHKKDVLKMVEESFELLGEAFFLSAFVAAFVDIKTREK
jgi:hypothetical protein